MTHVLVPVDDSEPASAALEFACEQYPDGRFTLLYVVDPMIDYARERAYPGYATGDDPHGNEREKGEAVLESLRETVPTEIDVETVLEVGAPARAIVRYAENDDVETIVIGSHGRDGSARYLLGSVAETVVRRSPESVPVTVVK
ncbi:universal stress protein [Halobacteria archaeon AArc-m2/3/4]|uniref:Universal stress protein n=1 Tax=Natronoglomus mannanivorans TaxID=2979990 RepID=A0AAP3E1F6_9EURY|nr:universal stress protein [Halobacteria archaeon AArc-xg1-1]MCU4973658.1 universal stress protein [Halobacteria archaeon AArc-m2/3/4]